MLILTRRDDEAIQIGDDIRIVVVRTQAGQVKLGIKAPEGVRVLRAELGQWNPSKPCGISKARDRR